MAQDDEIERLIAEADAILGRGPAAPPPARLPARASTASQSPRPRGPLESTVRVSAISGGVAAAGVFGAFAVLPFFGAISGAAGAFVATFCIVLGQRIVRRKR